MKFSRGQSILAVAVALLIGVLWGALAPAQEVPETKTLELTVRGEFGAALQLSADGQMGESPQTHLIIDGKGREIQPGGQLLYVASSYGYSASGTLTPVTEQELVVTSATNEKLGELAPFIIGRREGTREVIEFPHAQGGGGELVVLDLLPSLAHGEMREWANQPAGLQISEADGVPALSVDGLDITRTDLFTLTVGSGAQVAAKQSVWANYLLANEKGEVIESTYGNPEPAFINPDEVFPALSNAILDQRIGSRVITLVPASEARGASDMIIVIDLLALATEG